MATAITELGTGILNWTRYERVGDRYGAVMLASDPMLAEPHWSSGDPGVLTHEAPGTTYVAFADAPYGKHGRLYAVVLATRDSPHIGDLFHGFRPGGAVKGERVLLGEGRLFDPLREQNPSGHGWENHGVGLVPDDGRDEFWLDPEALYRCHEQTVRLELEATEREA